MPTPLHAFAVFLSPPEDQTIGNNEKMGEESSRAQKQTHPGSKSFDIQRITKDLRQGSSQEQDRGNDAASHGQKGPTDHSLPAEERRPTNINTELHADPASRPKGEDLRLKLSAFKFKARKARVPVYNQDLNVHQPDTHSGGSRRTPGVCGSLNLQVDLDSQDQGGTSSGRKRKHSSSDSGEGASKSESTSG